MLFSINIYGIISWSIFHFFVLFNSPFGSTTSNNSLSDMSRIYNAFLSFWPTTHAALCDMAPWCAASSGYNRKIYYCCRQQWSNVRVTTIVRMCFIVDISSDVVVDLEQRNRSPRVVEKKSTMWRVTGKCSLLLSFSYHLENL